MDKQIEPGCKAEVFRSSAGNQGKIVTVLGYAGPPGFDGADRFGEYGDRWYVDVPLLTNMGDTLNHAGEGQLRRIDDYDGSEKTSWEELRDIWQPKKLAAI